MPSSKAPPALSFKCPKLWQEMSGTETSRFCEQCDHQVHNISLLSHSEREALIAKSETSRVCVAYSQDLKGNLIEATSEKELTSKIRTLRMAALASGALALSACSTEKNEPPQTEFAQPVTPPEDCLMGIMIAPSDLERFRAEQKNDSP